MLETRPPDLCRQFAAAGLMHCCSLLRGIRALEDANLGALVGILERQHCEMWLVGLYILLGGDKALSEFESRYVQHTRGLIKTTSLKLGSEYDPGGKGPSQRLSLYEIAMRLGPLLEDAGETVSVDALKKLYDVIYKVQSEFAMHAGLATVRPYIRRGESSWSAEPNPPAPLKDIGLNSALYKLFFAKHVFIRFGIATDAVEAAMGELLQCLSSEGASSRPE